MNSAVIDMSKVSERKEVATVSDATTLMQVIERAARDPSVDIERMERLLQMHERLVAKQGEAAYAEALARLQPKLPIIQERGAIKNNAGTVQSKYALWEDIVGVITPILAEEGFSLSFRIAHPDGKIEVTGVLTHQRGHSERTPILLPADTSGSKNAVQAVASSVSYGKRYTAGALLNLRSGELDDDAQTASTPLPLSADQVAQVERRLKEANVDRKGFLEFWQVEEIWNIPACNFSLIMQRLDKGAKNINPRGDISGVDMTLRDKHVASIKEILESDKEECDVADLLREYIAEALNPFPELYTAVSDQLARGGIITKEGMKSYLTIPGRDGASANTRRQR